MAKTKLNWKTFLVFPTQQTTKRAVESCRK